VKAVLVELPPGSDADVTGQTADVTTEQVVLNSSWRVSRHGNSMSRSTALLSPPPQQQQQQQQQGQKHDSETSKV